MAAIRPSRTTTSRRPSRSEAPGASKTRTLRTTSDRDAPGGRDTKGASRAQAAAKARISAVARPMLSLRRTGRPYHRRRRHARRGGSRSVLAEERARVDRLARHDDLVVKVRPRAPAGAPDEPDDLPPRHPLADFPVGVFQVALARAHGVAVIERDVLTEATLGARLDDRPRRRRLDRRPRRAADVDPLLNLGRAVPRRAPRPVPRFHRSAHRPPARAREHAPTRAGGHTRQPEQVLAREAGDDDRSQRPERPVEDPARQVDA